ncbi:hypothetical protein ACFWGN_12070 [Oerskovia sp. NPDC060338]|uniref:hypothetical protein n=1 Tax=Oerskovia sp. NPDC060338 TaxID=3347100 RepID=UPI00364F36E9
MSSARPVRESRPRRPGRTWGGPDEPPLPPALAAQLARRGWKVSGSGPSRDAQRADRPVWVVVDGAGRQDDLTLVPVPAEPGERAQVVERLGVLRALDHEHLATIDEVVEGDAAHLGVLTRRSLGTSLDLLLACRAPLSAGEAVTLVVPLAQALAALHVAGQTYGALDRKDVTVGADGRAVLRAPLEVSTGSPAEDVRALAALVTGLVPPPATLHAGARGAVGPGEGNDEALSALHAELAAAQRADPRGRPEAGTFAALCYEAAMPLPIVLPDPARLAAAAIAERPGPRGVGGTLRAVAEDAPGPRPRRGASAGGTVSQENAPPRRVARRARGHDGGDPAPGTRAAARARAGGRGRAEGTAGQAPPTGGRTGGRTGPGRDRGGRSRGPRHPVLVAVLVLTLCAALAGGGLALRSWAGAATDVRDPAVAGPRAEDRVAAGTDPTRRHDDPLAAAVELTERRVELLAGDRALAEVVVPGSPAEQADAELLERITGAGVVVEGARAEVLDARSTASGRPDAVGADGAASSPAGSPDEASVEVTYVVGAHTQRTADGAVIQVPAASPQVAVLTLRWADGAWRVGEVG